MFFAEYIHRLDPFALRVTETWGLRWYGLSYAAGFLLAWLVIRWLARSGRSPLTVQMVGDFIFYVIAGVLIGGRLGYVAFYDPSLFGFADSFPYWQLLAINRGGMASHGGIIGSIAACIVFGRRHRVSILHLLDLIAFTCPLGLGLGRLANFVNGELWGKALPDQTDPPWWAIKYPEEILTTDFPHRAEIADALAVVVEGDQRFFENVVALARDGHETVLATIRPLLTAFYPSQLVQAAAEGPILLASLVVVWLAPRRPGVVGSWFLIVYGILRILTEIVRQPDVGVSLFLGLSRGQTLSVVMVLAGAIVLTIVARRRVPKLGGLRQPVRLADEPRS